MSRITGSDAHSLMEAYNSIYVPIEDQNEIEELGIQIIENAANVLFSQGYNIEDLCDYFEEASTEVISEDYLNFVEGQTYISESFIVSDNYVQEQIELLNIVLDEATQTRLQKMAAKKGKVLWGPPGMRPQSTTNAAIKKYGGTIRGGISGGIPNTIKQNRPNTPSSNPRVTSSNNVQAWQGPARPPAGTQKPGFLQKAGNFAKGLMSKAKDVVKKIPGAGIASKIAKSPVGKFAGKVGSKVLPGLGVAAYGLDAASRFKKGDWGGGLLSTAGAVTSAIPGAGLVAGLAPAGIQMATDALGLTGDKSRKGNAPTGSPKPKGGAGTVNIPGKGQRYYSSSDKKYYKNYNDALAARRSRRGETTTAPSLTSKPASTTPSTQGAPTVSNAPRTPSGGAGGAGRSTSQRRTPQPSGQTGDKEKDMETWARTHPDLAARVKPGQAGSDVISRLRDKPSDYEKQDQTPTQGSPTAQVDPSSVQADIERLRKRAEQQRNTTTPTTTTTKESYEPYDIILEYLIGRGHADTINEANYIMMEMDQNAIGIIMQEYNDYLLAEEVSEWVDGLLEEGYDLSDYTWDDIVEYYVTEANREEREKGMNKTQRTERRDAGWENPKNRPDYNRVGHQRNRRNDPTPKLGDPSELSGRNPGNREYHTIGQVFGTELPSGRIITGKTNQYVNPSQSTRERVKRSRKKN